MSVVTDPDVPTREWIREAVTMALYVGLSVLAVIVALPSAAVSDRTPALTVALTAIGLLLAHQVAFRLSSRLVNHGLLDEDSRRMLGAQLVGGLATAALAAVPVLVFGGPGIRVSAILLIGLVGGVGFLSARSAGAGRVRAMLYVGGLVLVVAGLLVVKSLVGH